MQTEESKMFEERFIKEITPPNRKSHKFQNFMKNRDNLPTPMYKISNDYQNMVEKATVVDPDEGNDKLNSIKKAIEVNRDIILEKFNYFLNFPASPNTL